ncbi:hypothetical protein XENOCAPTIV_010819 [Xenoophorus captivus]|uniref:IF rod domain-containing protein n=1 Tax=Xenoophorus captivus TaxID=1517983 RepID=A0ABV0S6A8_9TELE
MSYTRSAPQYRANSIYGGAGGQGARISSASASSLRSGIPISSSSSSFKLSSMMGGGAGGAGGAFGGAGAAAASGSSAGILGNEKGAMQNLNDRLANYLETVRNLEQANKNLEMNIREALEKGGQDVRDYSKYEPFIEDLRNQEYEALLNMKMKLEAEISTYKSAFCGGGVGPRSPGRLESLSHVCGAAPWHLVSDETG